MKILAIGGEPCSGKTTLVKTIMAGLGRSPTDFKYGLLRGRRYAATPGVWVLGIYAGETFDGTDKLSMAVQRDAETFLRDIASKYPDDTVVFEGDRLFNQSFIRVCRELTPEFLGICLTVDEEEKDRRHHSRGDTQSAKFLAGRKTKYLNILEAGLCVQARRNNNQADNTAVLAEIFGFLEV
jgi:hypothetical protein